MKHKHYDMIVAKAENMDLETFLNLDGKWKLMVNAVPISEESEYFLCLPQHKEACLHWLNGGGVQDNFEGEWSDCPFLSQTINTDSENSLTFSVHHMFMNEEFNFRIAPKKEKRWIIVDPKTDYTFNGLYFSKESAENENGSSHQVIEIEVEVQP